jgi:DNA excision repair protein ERCC-1
VTPPRDLTVDVDAGDIGALYLSLQYHALHPKYIVTRIQGLQVPSLGIVKGQRDFRGVLLLAVVDASPAVTAAGLRLLNKLALNASLTLITVNSSYEAALVIALARQLQGKGASLISGTNVSAAWTKARTASSASRKGDEADGDREVFASVITSFRTLNATNAAELGENIGSFVDVARASKEELSLVPGMGPTRVAKLHAVLRAPLLPARAAGEVAAKRKREEEGDDE